MVKTFKRRTKKHFRQTRKIMRGGNMVPTVVQRAIEDTIHEVNDLESVIPRFEDEPGTGEKNKGTIYYGVKNKSTDLQSSRPHIHWVGDKFGFPGLSGGIVVSMQNVLYTDVVNNVYPRWYEALAVAAYPGSDLYKAWDEFFKILKLKFLHLGFLDNEQLTEEQIILLLENGLIERGDPGTDVGLPPYLKRHDMFLKGEYYSDSPRALGIKNLKEAPLRQSTRAEIVQKIQRIKDENSLQTSLFTKIFERNFDSICRGLLYNPQGQETALDSLNNVNSQLDYLIRVLEDHTEMQLELTGATREFVAPPEELPMYVRKVFKLLVLNSWCSDTTKSTTRESREAVVGKAFEKATEIFIGRVRPYIVSNLEIIIGEINQQAANKRIAEDIERKEIQRKADEEQEKEAEKKTKEIEKAAKATERNKQISVEVPVNPERLRIAAALEARKNGTFVEKQIGKAPQQQQQQQQQQTPRPSGIAKTLNTYHSQLQVMPRYMKVPLNPGSGNPEYRYVYKKDINLFRDTQHPKYYLIPNASSDTLQVFWDRTTNKFYSGTSSKKTNAVNGFIYEEIPDPFKPAGGAKTKTNTKKGKTIKTRKQKKTKKQIRTRRRRTMRR